MRASWTLPFVLAVAACGGSDDAPPSDPDAAAGTDAPAPVDASSNPPAPIDPDFGTHGFGWIEHEQGERVFLNQVVPGPGGTVYASGFTVGPDSWLLVCRFTAAGARDTSWADDGCYTGTTGSFGGTAISTAAGLVVGGGRGNEATLWRFSTAGALDPSFGAGGVASLGAAVNASVNGVTSDGTDLVVVGPNADFDQLRVARLDASGAVTASGLSALPEGSNRSPHTLVRRADGTFAVGLGPLSSGGGAVVEVTADLATFVPHPTATSDAVVDVVPLADGTTLVLDVHGVSRLLATGAPDPAFATNGRLDAPVVGLLETWRALAVLPDGRIAVGGRGGTSPGDAIVRLYTAAGAPDPSFATAGLLTFPNRDADMIVVDLTVAPDGALLVAGQEDATFPRWAFTSRLLPL